MTKRAAGSDAMAARRLRELWEQMQIDRVRAGKPKLTQAEAARAMDITQSAVGQYLRGEIPLLAQGVLKWARFLRVPPTDIREDLAELTGIPTLNQTGVDVRLVPVVDTAADLLAFLQGKKINNPRMSWPIPMETHDAPPYGPLTFALALADDACNPLAFRGDLVVIDPATRVQPGELAAAVSTSGDIVLGHLHRKADGSARLVPANPAYPEAELPAGHAVWRVAACLRRF
jgi:transcriptional regulator with XRE-family HTH domain